MVIIIPGAIPEMMRTGCVDFPMASGDAAFAAVVEVLVVVLRQLACRHAVR